MQKDLRFFSKDVLSLLQRSLSVLSPVHLVSVETLPLCLLGHKMVRHQVSSTGVTVCNVSPESGGQRCMLVVGNLLGHHPGVKMGSLA